MQGKKHAAREADARLPKGYRHARGMGAALSVPGSCRLPPQLLLRGVGVDPFGFVDEGRIKGHGELFRWVHDDECGGQAGGEGRFLWTLADSLL